jgi:hypothetical protein
MPILTGGGSMYSTVEDMQRWDASVLSWVMLADGFLGQATVGVCQDTLGTGTDHLI